MAVHFQVLASGSAGNASLLDIDGYGVLVDFGLGPRQLSTRFGGGFWDHVRAALLTHTHGDHWNENTFGHLVQRRIPVWCHPDHAADLRAASSAFQALAGAGLVREYEVGQPFPLGPGSRCEPFPVKHDGGMTCGFRLEGPHDIFGCSWALAYAADLGSWDAALVNRLANVDVLALEFNHDVAMQYQSGRSARLIRRVLGDHGHLSNAQAGALFAAVLKESEPGRLRHLIQLHLSSHCNRPELARAAAHPVAAAASTPVEVHTAAQDEPGPSLGFGDTPPAPRRRRWPTRRRGSGPSPSLFQGW